MPVWGNISMKGCTDLYRQVSGTPTAIRYQDEILGLIVRPYASPGFLGYMTMHSICRQFLEDEEIDTTDQPVMLA